MNYPILPPFRRPGPPPQGLLSRPGKAGDLWSLLRFGSLRGRGPVELGRRPVQRERRGQTRRSPTAGRRGAKGRRKGAVALGVTTRGRHSRREARGPLFIRAVGQGGRPYDWT